MRLLIDGYNLMYERGLMRERFGPDGFRKARHRFLTELAAALDPVEAHQTIVVFDAVDAPRGLPSEIHLQGLTIVFAVDDKDADERIEKLIAAHSSPKTLTVVSSDHRIRVAAERRKAKAMPSDAFLVMLDERGSKPRELKPSPLSAEEKAREHGLSPLESAEWLNVFSDLAAEPLVRLRPSENDFVPTDEEIARIEREVQDESV
jgi:hypothetical protein